MAKSESKIVKVRPDAQIGYSDGIDGRNPHYYVSYYCPNCRKYLNENDIACDQCGTFFDWTMRARVRLEPVLDWVVSTAHSRME